MTKLLVYFGASVRPRFQPAEKSGVDDCETFGIAVAVYQSLLGLAVYDRGLLYLLLRKLSHESRDEPLVETERTNNLHSARQRGINAFD